MLNKKGYTLIEMLLVLLIISTVLISFNGLKKWKNNRLKVILLNDYLSYAQSMAVKDKRNIKVSLNDDTLIIDNHEYYIKDLKVNSYDYYYNELGNISKGGSISFKNNQYQIVLNIGSGCHEIK